MWCARFQRLDYAVDTAMAFSALFKDATYAFWLDSSLTGMGGARFSYLGGARVGGARVGRARVGRARVAGARVAGASQAEVDLSAELTTGNVPSRAERSLANPGQGGEVLTYRVGSDKVEVADRGGSWTEAGSIFDVLAARLEHRKVLAPRMLPFDLVGGYVGYLGYELKADLGVTNRHSSPTPDAVFVAATRLVVVDHLTNTTWLVAVSGQDPGDSREAEAWLAEAARRLSALPATPESPPPGPPPGTGNTVTQGTDIDPSRWLDRPRNVYLLDIEECQRRLRNGESYEICLTNTLEVPFAGDPVSLYMNQRRNNPAPYAAYLQFDDLHVLSSSPERFLKVGPDRTVESRPIKGTAARSQDPTIDAMYRNQLSASSKAQAENLMIVDLLRNDLGRICEIGSIHVPSLNAVETYATVHQMVSTVRGRLRPDVGAVDAVRACFPPGSMTGAPKIRTMEILDSLERRARGVYAGALGFFSLSGTADLSVVIRTAVVKDGRLTVGTGGAIVLDSDPAEEYDEMLLKARAPIAGLALDDSAMERQGIPGTARPATGQG